MNVKANALKQRMIGRGSPARILAGRLKFRTSQIVANRSVPIYRSIRGIDRSIAERHLFVLAHPRSGSTVLSHVLHGHPEIAGFGEHHVSYIDADDLTALEARTAYFARDPRLESRYVLDKIVLNKHEVDQAILQADTTRFVFLLREPAETLQSYARMFPDLPTDEDRFRSYRRRLTALVKYLETINDPKRAFFLTYDELTSETPAALDALTRWLELGSPLLPEYELTAKTGSQSWGDPSANIKAGKILTLDRAPEASAVNEPVLATANDLYRSTIDIFRTMATTLDGKPSEIR